MSDPSTSADDKKKAYFCSSLVMSIWINYFKTWTQTRNPEQKTRQLSPRKAQIQSFSANIDPTACTPLDLLYLTQYFPNLFEFETDLSRLRKGCILWSNFYGAPRYGHAMLVLNDAKKTIAFMGMPQTEIPILTFGNGERQCRYTLHVNDADLSQKGRYQIYAINPKEGMIDNDIFDAVVRQYKCTDLSYSVARGIMSAFRICYKKRSLFLVLRRFLGLDNMKPTPIRFDEFEFEL